MHRLAPFLVLAFVLAGCGGTETVSPTAETVVGKVATTTQAAAGDAKAGATLFTSQGCGGCHTFKPAGTNGTVGPDLDKLAQYAKTANQGSLQDFTQESIANPSAYIEKGYPNAMPNFGQTLSAKQIADLVAYLTQNQG
ncbi:MAG TPA: cytochrome c [Gaiellaceae bacterium]|jgi:mono/diheme cytochrome c family protein|nr:cytochrome c [Gaiellaceae bacterium]